MPNFIKIEGQKGRSSQSQTQKVQKNLKKLYFYQNLIIFWLFLTIMILMIVVIGYLLNLFLIYSLITIILNFLFLNLKQSRYVLFTKKNNKDAEF